MGEQRVIGLLGGMSWPSTITYYRALNTGVQRALGGSHSARVLVWSGDYAEVEAHQLGNRWEEAGELLAAGARRLVAGGAEVIGIACNTMHLVADAVRATTSVPLVDIVQATADAVSTRAATTAAVLGTAFTMDSGIYEKGLAAAGVTAVRIPPADRALIDGIIYRELCLGQLSVSSRTALEDVVVRLGNQGADVVILACTELGEALAGQHCAGVDLVDTLQVHVQALLAASLPPGAVAQLTA